MLVKKDISYNLMSANNTCCSTFLLPPIEQFLGFCFVLFFHLFISTFFFGKYLFMYLTVVGLNFSTEELCCIICDLSSWCMDSSCGSQAQQLYHMGFDAPQCVGSQFPDQEARNQTHIPCIARQIPNHWTTREVLLSVFLTIPISHVIYSSWRVCSYSL